ncbi:M16 family metallopeptidase [Chondromyces apiculatus]|uniref:Protease n=1 Tax=Chondromyces apiculatus DSM 436 TaxID=1192034 RepID=A0A017T1M5_9BACT|nr:pitrilysin family protein [Chondromyces apiculatus]EYF03154.1 Protease precursor [Chondromyces apiculatus DSM 436]
MQEAALREPSPAGRGEAIQPMLETLNQGSTPLSRITHDASIDFGPSLRVERFLLGNGLRVLILEDHHAPVISLQTWFGVGSRHEVRGKTGLAHLFEHLMFGETENVPPGVFDRTLEEAGAETNAATSLDWTFYHTNLPREALESALRLEAERMTRLILRDPQVASEKEVVSNERRQRVDDDVDGAVNELLYKEAFREHAYGWPTIGWMEDISAFNTADCLDFYRAYYAPNNAILVIVGDTTCAHALRLIQQHYGARAPSVIPVEDVRPEPRQVDERQVTVKKPTVTHKLAIGYKSPALGDFDHAPLVLLNEILFCGRSSRVHRALVQEQEIVSEVRGWVGSFRDEGLYDLYLAARGERTSAEVLEALDVLLDQVRREPVLPSELDRAKARLELSLLQGMETTSGKAEQIGFYETVLGDPGALFQRLAAYQRVTLGDLLRVARRYLLPSTRTVVHVAPSGELPPDEGEEDDDDDGDNDAQPGADGADGADGDGDGDDGDDGDDALTAEEQIH